MTTLPEMLATSTWGRTLTPAELDRVISESFERQVPAGGFAARMGQRVEHWTGVIEGLLKMSVTSADGKVSTLTGINAGGWYGEGSLLKREPRRYDVVALRPSRLVLVPHATFEWLRANSLPFNHHLHHLMNARLSLFIGMLEYDRLLSTDARVALPGHLVQRRSLPGAARLRRSAAAGDRAAVGPVAPARQRRAAHLAGEWLDPHRATRDDGPGP